MFALLRHMPINELRAIATFAKAVELGSLRRAAQAQGISPQAAKVVGPLRSGQLVALLLPQVSDSMSVHLYFLEIDEIQLPIVRR